MKRIRIRTIALVLIFAYTALTSALAGDTKTIKGMITGRTADTLTVRAEDATTWTVTLNDETKVQTPKGLGIRKEQMSWASLLPGLKVKVKGFPDASGNLLATEIGFSKKDLQTASMIQAGLTPTEEKVATNAQNIAANQENIAANKENIAVNSANVAANKAQIAANQREVTRRFEDLADYDVRTQATIYFASGETTLGPDDKAALSKVAAEAAQVSGYIIEVQGFADSSGNAVVNQSLSKDRAYAVVNYLMQEGAVPPRHIVAPGAMGISKPVASNETKQGRSANRRVEVKLLVNKGILSASQ